MRTKPMIVYVLFLTESRDPDLTEKQVVGVYSSLSLAEEGWDAYVDDNSDAVDCDIVEFTLNEGVENLEAA